MSVTRRHSQTSRGSIRRGSKPQAVPLPTNVNMTCAVLGDGDVGKTTMLLTFLCGRCPSDIAPGPMDGHSEFDHLTQSPYSMTVESTQVKISFIDTYGQDEYEKLRERQCSSADIYILCYDVTKPSTFDRLRHHWLPEIRRYGAPDSPFIVVGLKSDVRSASVSNAPKGEEQESNEKSVVQCMSYTQAMKDSAEMGAAHYVECSARTRPLDVRRVVEKTVQAAVMAGNHSADVKRTSCSVS